MVIVLWEHAVQSTEINGNELFYCRDKVLITVVKSYFLLGLFILFLLCWAGYKSQVVSFIVTAWLLRKL